MIRKGKKPEIGWSLHMTEGWQSQLDRVRGWYHRALTAEDPTEKYDFLCAFFESAFHLRDWLKNTGKVSEQDLCKLFDVNENMRLCRDLANSHKHYSINNPSQLVPPSEVREYSPKSGNLTSNVSLVILSDGKKHNAFDLAKCVMRVWEDFINSCNTSQIDNDSESKL
jgi:hypothetical protein